MEENLAVYESKIAAGELAVSERTLQKWAKEGRIRFETIRKKGTANQVRLYNGDDVRRVKEERATGYVVAPKRERIAQPHPDSLAQPRTALVPAAGLDPAPLFADLLKQLELQATTSAETLKNVVAQIFAERQAERDAARYRFDAERADRAERAARKTRIGQSDAKRKAARA